MTSNEHLNRRFWKEYISHDYNVSREQRLLELNFANKVRSKNKFRVLDICCRRFPRGFGVDLHPESNADLRCDAHRLPFRDKSFDLTLCVEGIEHLINPGMAVMELSLIHISEPTRPY